MDNEELVFIYDDDYYAYRKDSLGEHIIPLIWGEDDEYLYVCNDSESYTKILEYRDSWKILEGYKRGWVFPHTDVSNILEHDCVWPFPLCYYYSKCVNEIEIFTRWEDIMPWVMKLVLLSSNVEIEVEFLGIFHNDHGHVEFSDSKSYRQFVGDMVDELFLEGEV